VCWLAAGVCLTAGLGLAWHHPVSPMLALVMLCLATCLVAWQPRLWLWLVPACLPWLNFSPWTGWLVFEEFDILLLGTLAGGYARLAWDSPTKPTDAFWRGKHGLAVGVLLSGLLSLWRGVADAGGWSFDWFANYSDALNSWRVFKSLGFAALFIPLLRRELALSSERATATLAAGVVSGLVVVVMASLWERAAFPGLLDFSDPYRTVALFWEMHVGGAAIDSYLALTAPFLVWALSTARRPALWAGLAVLVFLDGYICLTTFARGVYLAVLAPLLLLAVLLWVQKQALHGRSAWQSLNHQSDRRNWRLKASVVLLAALVVEVLVVLEGGTFMSERIASARQDFSSRTAHWKSGIGLLHSPTDWLIGKGLGRLPANYAAQVPKEEFPGGARFHRENRAGQPEQQFVTLYGPQTQEELGGVFELTQRVALAEPTGYRVQLDVRVKQTTHFELFLCERHLLYDRACQAAYLDIHPAEGMSPFAWQHKTVALEGPPLAVERWFAPRLKMFSISVVDAGAQADVDNIVLTGSRPQTLLRNGNFSRGLAHWFPAAQSYFVPWHLDNLALEVLVERGMLGLLAGLLLVVYALWRLVLGDARLRPLAPYLVASLVAILLVGLVSSVMDVPRVAFLFFLLIFLSIESSGRPQDTEP